MGITLSRQLHSPMATESSGSGQTIDPGSTLRGSQDPTSNSSGSRTLNLTYATGGMPNPLHTRDSMNQSQNPFISRDPVNNYIETVDAVQTKISAVLGSRHVAAAVYGAQIRSVCVDGIRVQELRDIEAWIKDWKAPQILLLVGMAGTGKSTIAWTVCSRAANDPEIVLGGSFFCSRSSGLESQRDVRCVVPTLAQLLARQSLPFAQALVVELAHDPDILYQQVGVQVEKLLYRPLLALKDSSVPILFVIDALDEVGGQLTRNGMLNEAETRRITSEMLEALVIGVARFATKIPIKFLFTSRPEAHILETVIADTAFCKVFQLHPITKEQEPPQ